MLLYCLASLLPKKKKTQISDLNQMAIIYKLSHTLSKYINNDIIISKNYQGHKKWNSKPFPLKKMSCKLTARYGVVNISMFVLHCIQGDTKDILQ